MRGSNLCKRTSNLDIESVKFSYKIFWNMYKAYLLLEVGEVVLLS